MRTKASRNNFHIKNQYEIYNDREPMLHLSVNVSFNEAQADASKIEFDENMLPDRVAFDRNYMDLKQEWTSGEFHLLLKVRQAPIARLYQESKFILNMNICLKKVGYYGHYFEILLNC